MDVELSPHSLVSFGSNPHAKPGRFAPKPTSPRVEPIVETGQIWATEEFRQQFLERPSLWRTSPLTAPGGEELFNVKKKGSQEPDTWFRLYRLES